MEGFGFSVLIHFAQQTVLLNNCTVFIIIYYTRQKKHTPIDWKLNFLKGNIKLKKMNNVILF